MQNLLCMRSIFAIGCFVAISLFINSMALAGSVWLTMGNPYPLPRTGGTFETELEFSSWDATIGAYLVTVNYDPAILQILEVKTSPESEFYGKTFADEGSFTSGSTEITAFQVDNTADQNIPATFATIKWKVLGPSGTSSDIEVEVKTMVDASLGPVDVMSYANPIFVSEDSDDDGMPDLWEQQIIDADPDDGINNVSDVSPGDDFDGDGETNLTEYNNGTLPIDALSTEDPNKAYSDFNFEIFRGAEQMYTGLTPDTWGAELVCRAKDGAIFISGTLSKPDGSNGLLVVDLDILNEGRAANFSEENYTSLTELMADFISGKYYVDLVVDSGGSSTHHLRFTINVPEYDGSTFPSYITIQEPLPSENNVSVTPQLVFDTPCWDYLYINRADTGEEAYFSINDAAENTHQVSQENSLLYSTVYVLDVDVNDWNSTWLGSRTSVLFETEGPPIEPKPVFVKKLKVVEGNKLTTLNPELLVNIKGNGSKYKAWEYGFLKPNDWMDLLVPDNEGIYHVFLELDPVDPGSQYFGAKRIINVQVANEKYESKPKEVRVTLAVPKLSAFKVNANNKAAPDDAVPVTFKVKGDAINYYISCDQDFNTILASGPISGLNVSDKSVYMVPSFDLSGITAVSKGKSFIKTVYIRVDNEVGYSKALKRVVKMVEP